MNEDTLENASELSYIDAHCHIGHDIDGTLQTAEMLLAKMECGIDHAIIFPFNEIDQEHCFKRANKLMGFVDWIHTAH
jgi:hypothetical protein